MAQTQTALQGLRVAEMVGGVATRYCGRLFAQLGAEVTSVLPDEPVDPEPLTGGAGDTLYGRWLDEGKKSAPWLEAVDGSPDLVIAGQDAASVAAAEAAMRGLTGPRPILLALTWFDPAGPYGDWSGTDETVHALTGIAYLFGEKEGPPTLPQGHTPQILGGVNAFSAALAAMLALPDQRPNRVDVNILESAVCVSEVAALAALDGGPSRSTRLGINRYSPTYPASSYRTADGWIGVTCLTPAQWAAMCSAIDRPDVAADRRFTTSHARLGLADEVDSILAPVIAGRSTDEWVAEGNARRIPITPMLSPSQLPGHEHWKARGSFAPVGDADVEAPVLPFHLRFTGDARGRWEPSDAPGPLSGLRVVDFSMGWAGPMATRLLADLGADVVKIESLSHPDWWRGWEADNTGDPPPLEIKTSFNAMNRNKRGIDLELTTQGGLATAKALLAEADVVVENFAAGVLDKLGLGPEVQRQLRPGVISLAMPAFGNGGPLVQIRAYGSTVEQASGMPFVNGRDDWPPALQHVAFGDPIGGMFAGAVLLAALTARSRVGGAEIDLAQVECLFQLNADAIIGEQVLGRPLPRTGNRRASAAPCCVVPCAEDDEWLAVVVSSELAWRGLCSAFAEEEWAGDPELSTVAGRNRSAEMLEGVIASWAIQRTAEEAAGELRRYAVPAVAVQPAHALGQNPQLEAAGFFQTLERRYVGRHAQSSPAFRFDGVRPALRRPAPTLGEHTDEVLADIAGR